MDHPPHDLHALLQQIARPLFEDAARHARQAGLEAVVRDEANSVGPALCLEVARPGERPSRYRLLGDTAAARVRHECFFADAGETRRLEAAPASVNETVLDTRLAAFFREAFGLSLDYTAERRQAGFW
ncbi:hypothetical protein [Metapseudomonas otitidis]|uniref:hypothetical protein n=1 Tax=Metapseudomonas otitidis TaxID=319939 RepID=UPI001AAEC91D|nr:hypothetical protein [Pseudomonas otitidis]MBO2926727.1 hypothetical protein [Pseudomonas otitidis]MDG9779916.1 hypothetical protein [Pseudomonas otitidis]